MEEDWYEKILRQINRDHRNKLLNVRDAVRIRGFNRKVIPPVETVKDLFNGLFERWKAFKTKNGSTFYLWRYLISILFLHTCISSHESKSLYNQERIVKLIKVWICVNFHQVADRHLPWTARTADAISASSATGPSRQETLPPQEIRHNVPNARRTLNDLAHLSH